MESGSIASWNLQEGDSFAAGDIICSVETDKATVDFEAQDDGVVAKLLVEAGPAVINCGEPIMVTVEDEEDVGAFKDFVASSAAAAAPAAAAPTEEPTPAAEPVAPPAAAAAAAAAAPTPAAPAVALGGERVVASPLAHMLAKELGHDISAIVGTGPGGRVIAADVKEFVPAAAAAAETPAATAIATAAPIPGVGYTDYALSASAQELAARLAQSKRNVPHYYLTIDVTMDELLKMRTTLNNAMSSDDDAPSLGVYEMLLKAVGAATKAVPTANASWMESVVRVYDSVDINVAVGNGDALYTPVIRDVATRGVKSLSQDLARCVAALEPNEEGETVGPLPEEFMSMGTLTVINLGMYGIKSCAPIIREPQATVLAFGGLENRIVPNDDGEDLYKQSVVMTATMSFDHRVVDGAVGAQWLAAFKSHVENPTTLLL